LLSDAVLFSAEAWYRLHYRQYIKPHLTRQQKIDIARRISDLTLRAPIWLDPEKDYRDQFPEIAPYVSKGVPLTGLYLVAILEEIVLEMRGEGNFAKEGKSC